MCSGSVFWILVVLFFFQAEDGIRDLVRSRGLGDVYKRQVYHCVTGANRQEFTESFRAIVIKLFEEYGSVFVINPILQRPVYLSLNPPGSTHLNLNEFEAGLPQQRDHC